MRNSGWVEALLIVGIILLVIAFVFLVFNIDGILGWLCQYCRAALG